MLLVHLQGLCCTGAILRHMQIQDMVSESNLNPAGQRCVTVSTGINCFWDCRMIAVSVVAVCATALELSHFAVYISLTSVKPMHR